MKLIVGLGNPGKEYDNTRHNIGFMFVDGYVNSKFSSVDWKKKFNGLYFETINNGELLKLAVEYLKSKGFSVTVQ